jgi:hypothetical protein
VAGNLLPTTSSAVPHAPVLYFTLFPLVRAKIMQNGQKTGEEFRARVEAFQPVL